MSRAGAGHYSMESYTMLDNYTLAAPGEQRTQLDDNTLATIVGGFGIPWEKLFQGATIALWECLQEGLDNFISAAEEGYADASG
jgi:hypothetical protein